MLIVISVLLVLILAVLTMLMLVIVNYLRVMNDTLLKSFDVLAAIAQEQIRMERNSRQR